MSRSRQSELSTQALPQKVSRDSSLPPFFSLRFATRGIGLAAQAIVIAQLTFFSTDVLGLPAAAIGALFLVARIFDAVTDLFINFIIDKTRTRWGKARPYELFIIPIWLLTIAIFATPTMSAGWQMTYIFVCFWLITAVCQTALNASEGVFLKRAIEGEERYAKVLGRQGLFIILVTSVASVVLPQLIAAWGDKQSGWILIAVLYGVPAIALGLVRFFTIKEMPLPDVDPNVERPTLKDMLRAIATNKYAFYLAGLVLLGSCLVNIGQTISTYYFKYILGDIGLQSYGALGSIILPFVFLLFPVAVRRIGGMGYIRITLAIAIVGYMAVFFVPHSVPIVIAGTILGAFGSALTMLIGFFNIQVMTYGQWRSGATIEAAPQAVTGFASKLGTGLGPAITGGLLAIAGYNGALDVQPDGVNTMIIAVFALIPAVLCAVMFVFSFVWKLDKRMDAINADIAAGVGATTSTAKI